MLAADPGPWVEKWLSAPRFNVYLAATGNDRALAIDLYEWNAVTSAAILHDLAHLEVAIRNAYDVAMVARSPAGVPHWTNAPLTYFPIVTRRARGGSYDANQRPRDQIAVAKEQAGHGALPGKVVAELPFGFWRYLSSSFHEVDLWRPYLHRAFARGTSRRDVDDAMTRLNRLRNRVAHHEPLLTEQLPSRYDDVMTVTGLISVDLQVYVDTNSQWLATVSQRPTP